MHARELMTAPVVTITPDHTAAYAAELMNLHGFTTLPVVDDDGRAIGILTGTDLMRHRYDRSGMTVADVMTTPMIGMGGGTGVEEVAGVLLDSNITAMPIVDGSHVVGILTRGDLVRAGVLPADLEARVAVAPHHFTGAGGGSER